MKTILQRWLGLLSLLYLLCANTYAQQPTQEWINRHDSQGPTTETQTPGKLITVDNDGNSYVTGTSTNQNTGNRSITTIKYSPSGTELWSKLYEGPELSVASAIVVDNVGNVFVAGYTYTGSNQYDFVTLRYNANSGDQIWAKTYSGPGIVDEGMDFSHDRAKAIAVDNQGSVYVTGESHNGSGGYDYATIRYAASDGSQEWVRTYNGNGNNSDLATAIAVDNLGSVYVTGSSYSSSGGHDYATIRYAASDGSLEWVRTYNGNGNSLDEANAIVVDNAGSVYVTGSSYSSSTGSDYATIRYATSNGNQEWVRIYSGNGDNDDEAKAIAVDNAGSIYVTGQSYSSSSYHDYVTIRYTTSDGAQIWKATFNSSSNYYDQASAIVVDNAGSVYVTGSSYGSTGSDYATIRYATSNGNQEWVRNFNGSGNNSDIPSSIAVDNAGSVYVTGSSYSSSTGSDYTTIRYATLNGNQEWVKLYDGGGSQEDLSVAVAVDDDGNSYITGQTYNNNLNRLSITTIKYSPTGEKLWVKTSENISPADIAVDNAGSVYVTGHIRYSAREVDFITIRYSTLDGNQVWAKTYSGTGSGDDHAVALAVDNNGSIYVTGYSQNSSTENDYTTIRYAASDGSQEWVRTYNGSGNNSDLATAIAVDNLGSVYVTGKSYSSSGGHDYATIRYAASDGAESWIRTYNGSGNSQDEATAIAVDNTGGVYVTGESVNSTGGYDYATIRYNTSTGYQDWVSTFNGSTNEHDRATAITVDNVGNVYVTGESPNIDPRRLDYVTVRYTATNGNQVWAKIFDGNTSGDDRASAIAVDNINGVYVTGHSRNINGWVFSTIKYATIDGTQVWDMHTAGPEDWAVAMALDNSNNVIVTGYSWGQDTGNDFLTVKYSQCPTIIEKSIIGASTAAINTTGSLYSLTGSGATSFNWSITDGNNTAYTNFTGQGTSSISVSWPSSPNVYKVSVTYSGGSGCASQTAFMYVSVFDPTAGFVTGGGWINSPQSNDYEYMQTAGRADWGFVAKYKKGQANEVDGSTQFQLETGTFTFKSIIHDARKLVIASGKANYKGRGTVSYLDANSNLVVDPRQFAFMIAATDGQYGGATGTDKFRIKVWVVNADGTDGATVYDNQIGCTGSLDENAEACTTIGGGSIVIHNPNSKSVSKGSTLIAETPNGLEAYPTAFSEQTTFAFTLEQTSSYTLELYDLKGALVKRIANGSAEAGKRIEHELRAEGMAKGLYLARLATGNTMQTVKVIVQK